MSKKDDLIKLNEDEPGLPIAELASRTGCSHHFARKTVGSNEKRGAINASTKQKESKTKKEFSDRSGYMEFYTNEHVKSIEDVIEKMGVDTEKWIVDKWNIIDNAWDVTMKNLQGQGEKYTNYQFKVKVWFKPKIENPVEEAIKLLTAKIPTLKVPKVKLNPTTGTLLEMSLLDAHFGKLSWGRETLRRDYDLDIACEDYHKACAQTLEWGSFFKPERILFVLGQDLMHTENYEGVTHKGGNVLDVDSRLPKIMYKAMQTTFECILMCRQIAPVDVMWISGNHDMVASLGLALSMKMAFKDDPRVTVDASPAVRKARLWGNLLVGFCHSITGRHEAWVNELAHAFPELWGKSVFREYHFGHKHKKREIKMHPVMTQGGVLMRQLTALSPIDAWHFENLFTDAVPGGESLIWTKDRGVIANFTAWTDAPVLENNGIEYK